MSFSHPTPRRGFLARLAGVTAALSTGSALTSSSAAALGQGQGQGAAASYDAWLLGLKGQHRCLFDFPLHGGGLPLVHMLNYINTYRTVYGQLPATVNAVGTLYGPPGEASIPLAWNDHIWDKYRIGEILKLNDPDSKAPIRRNPFFRTRAGDPVLFNGAMAAASIDNLQKLGATFLMCNNAFLIWMSFLSGSGSRGNPSEIEREIRANLLPGVVTVPAMVIAIEKAQGKGVAYNRQ